jgi:hypothetical protein
MSSWEDPIYPRLMSRPIEVHWAGWRTDTYKLQQAGWQISMDQSLEKHALRVVIKNDEHRMIGLGGWMDMYHFNDRYNHPDNLTGRLTETAIYEMDQMAGDIRVSNRAAFVNFKAVDGQPRIEMEPPGGYSLRDLVPFAEAPLIRTKALILPEATVDDLLSGILARQAEAKTAYFKDMVEEERRAFPKHKVHAQIISLAA